MSSVSKCSLLLVLTLLCYLLYAHLMQTDPAVVSTGHSSSPDSAIPRILHQAFTSELVYENYRPYINSCLSANPDWTYVLWRDSDAERLLADHFPDLLPVYRGYGDNLQRSDAVRYAALHQFGVKKTPEEADSLEQERWRQHGCQLLASKRWRLNEADASTIGLHKFLHLGYEFAADTRMGLFNVSRVFPNRVTFYDQLARSAP